MLKIALLVLTLTEGGATRVTLSSTEDVEECENLKAVVTSLLSENGTPILAAICGNSGVELTPFDHGAGAEDEVHQYEVVLTDGHDFKLTPLDGDANCVPSPSTDPAVYCARSSQSVMGE